MVNILPVRRAVRVIMRGIKSINYGTAREHSNRYWWFRYINSTREARERSAGLPRLKKLHLRMQRDKLDPNQLINRLILQKIFTEMSAKIT